MFDTHERVSGLGTLSRLTKEIRQEIYGIALEIDRPITAKKCCTPESTFDERAECKVHSGAKNTGRFNILPVSKDVSEDAHWVLFNRGNLRLDLGPAFRVYFTGWKPNTNYHSSEILRLWRVRDMWLATARYRFVELVLTQEILETENPEEYTVQLYEIATRLFEGWKDAPHGPTSPEEHSVTINLGNLFAEIIPFNAEPPVNLDQIDLLLLINFLGPTPPDFEKIAWKCMRNLKRFISLVARCKELSKWKIVAFDQLAEESSGLRSLQVFKKVCDRGGVKFEGLSRITLVEEGLEDLE